MKVLRLNGYPENLLMMKKKDTRDKTSSPKDVTQPELRKKPPVVTPYVKGVSEHIRRVMSKFKVQVFFKPVNTLRQLLVRPKDPLDKERVIGLVYQIKCSDCDAFYVGETERSVKTGFLEHRRPSSTGSEVSHRQGHGISLDKTKILCVEPKYFERGVKEAILIRKLKPFLNRDGGRHRLPEIWTNVLTHESGRHTTGDFPAHTVTIRDVIVMKIGVTIESSM